MCRQLYMHHVDSTVLLANAEACCPLMWFQSCWSYSGSTSTCSGKVCTYQYPPLCSFRSASAQMTNKQMTRPSLKLAFFSISGCFAHALVARIIRIMKRSSNIKGRLLLFEYSIYSFHPYLGATAAVLLRFGSPNKNITLGKKEE